MIIEALILAYYKQSPKSIIETRLSNNISNRVFF